MRKPGRHVIIRVLLNFSKLNDTEQTLFISQMNEFLLASCRRRKLLVEQWRSELPKNSNDHARNTGDNSA